MRHYKRPRWEGSNESNIVDLYWATLPRSISGEQIRYGLSLLDPEELVTYGRYKVEHKRVEFLAGRVLAKTVIGDCLDVPPRTVLFAKNDWGKLYLGSPNYQLYFNLSHSNGVVVLAASLSSEVGVDVESMLQEPFEVMKHVFNKGEIEWVNAQRNSQAKLFAFYQLWTRKEAILKLLGRGFSLSPLSVSVPLNSGHVSTAEFEISTFGLGVNFLVSVAVPKCDITTQFIAREAQVFT